MKIYDYLYYRVYQIIKEINDDAPEFVSIIAFSMFLGVQYGFIFGILIFLFPELIRFANNDTGIILGICVMVFNFIYFLYGNHCAKIIERFRNEKQNELIKTMIFVIYFIIMIVALFYIMSITSVR